MKTFEIEVVRTYTTTIYVETADHLMASDIKRITMFNDVLEEELDIYDKHSQPHDINRSKSESIFQRMKTIILKKDYRSLVHLVLYYDLNLILKQFNIDGNELIRLCKVNRWDKIRQN